MKTSTIFYPGPDSEIYDKIEKRVRRRRGGLIWKQEPSQIFFVFERYCD